MPEAVLAAIVTGVAGAVFAFIGSVLTMISQSRTATADLQARKQDLEFTHTNAIKDANVNRLRDACSALLDAALLAQTTATASGPDKDSDRLRWFAEQAHALQSAAEKLNNAIARLGTEPLAGEIDKQAETFRNLCVNLANRFDSSARNPGTNPPQETDDDIKELGRTLGSLRISVRKVLGELESLSTPAAQH